MKLYYHPVSTTSRPVVLFATEEGIDLDYQVVDILTGEHYGDPFVAINPNRQVPVLEDGAFRLTESSAILKYLAEKNGSAAYPKELQARARVNEAMDWVNSNFYRDWGYGLVYPQLFPHHKRPTDAVQSGTIDWAKEKTKNWLSVMDRHMLKGNSYLCGKQITLADYFAAPIISIGELIHCDFSAYPNVAGWYGKMKSLKSWNKVNEVFNGFVGSVKDKTFVSV